MGGGVQICEGGSKSASGYGAKRSETENTRFRADALHDIILEPVFRCLYSIVLVFCNKDI